MRFGSLGEEKAIVGTSVVHMVFAARSGSTFAEFLRLDHDQIFVNGLQRRVGDAGRAVEKRTAEENHIEPFDKRAAGKAVEQRLLVKTAGVKVGVAERGAEGRIPQALLAVDEFGFHAGVDIVLGDPVGEALGEREVVEGVGEVSDAAFDFDDLVDGACVAGAPRTDETDVERRNLGVLEPRTEEEVTAAETEAGNIGGCADGDLPQLGGKGGSGTLVGVEDEEPRMAER